MAQNPAADWSELGGVFYQRLELYKLEWEINFEYNRVAISRCGGPLAIVRDDRRLISTTAKGVGRSGAVTIAAPTGRLLGRFNWERGRLTGWGWTEGEVLLCCSDDGTVYPYSVSGELQPWQFSFGAQVQSLGVAEAVVWPTGVLVVCRNNEMYAVTDFAQPMPFRLRDLPPELSERHCIAVVEPHLTANGGLEVLVAAGDTVWSVSADSVIDHGLTFGRVVSMAVSPNGLLVALFSEDGKLWVLSADMQKNLTEFATRAKTPPEQLAWCGSDCVVLMWPEVVLMVGPGGDWLKHSYDEPARLFSETDGCRVLTRSRHELLRRVPEPLVHVFAIGSTAPAALLYDALDSFDKGQAKADETLRLVGAEMLPAVAECIEAAGHEFEPQTQKLLLRAAAFGHVYCPLDSRLPHHVFPGMCRTLRLLNALRQRDQGHMPVSHAQFLTMPPQMILQRLVNAKRYLLAMRISEFLGESPHSIVLQWASAKMASSMQLSDRQLLDALMEKLSQVPGLPFTQVAADAYSRGRPRLAALLLDYETRSSEQVPLLTSMGEDERALQKAVESADMDLVYLAVFNMYRKVPEFSAFAEAVNKHKPARDLFVGYTRRTDPDLLKSFYFATGDTDGTADAVFHDAIYGPRDEGLLEPQLAAKLMQQAGDLYAKSTASKDGQFFSQAALSAAKLLRAQLQLEAESPRRAGEAYQGLSVADTIAKCVVSGNTKAANALKNDFKVSDKHFCWIRLRALAAKRDWEGVVALAEEKKPPIGYLPFVEVAFDEKAPKHELGKLISKLPEPSARVEWFTQAGLMMQAQQAGLEASNANQSFTRQAQGLIKSTFERLGTAGVGVGGGGAGGSGV